MCLERRFEKTVMTVMAVDAFVLEVMGVRQSQRMTCGVCSLFYHAEGRTLVIRLSGKRSYPDTSVPW